MFSKEQHKGEIMTIIYNYDTDGNYINNQVALVDEFGAEILPENSTYLEPLEEKEGYKVKFNGEKWIYEEIPQTPEPTLDELKEQKREEINSAREQARSDEGAEFDDDIFDVDETSQSNILAQIKVAELLQDTEATYIYRSKTNKDHLLTVSELQQLGLKIAQKVNAIYAKSWELKAEVDKATTPEEVEAISWVMAGGRS